MCSCKNSAKNLQKFCRFFYNNFLQNFCKFFANWFGIRRKGTHFQVNVLFSRRGCWMIDSWPLVLFFFWKMCKKFAKKFAKKFEKKNWKKIAKNLQKIFKKIEKKFQNFAKCRTYADDIPFCSIFTYFQYSLKHDLELRVIKKWISTILGLNGVIFYSLIQRKGIKIEKNFLHQFLILTYFSILALFFNFQLRKILLKI